MSLGFEGFAKIVLQDDQAVIYSYGTANLNVEETRNPEHIMDGTITIFREALVEPEIHEKIRRRPSGRKILERKIIPVSPDFAVLFSKGLIAVENSQYCWRCQDEVDWSAIQLLHHIFFEYQMTGEPPERTGFIQ